MPQGKQQSEDALRANVGVLLHVTRQREVPLSRNSDCNAFVDFQVNVNDSVTAKRELLIETAFWLKTKEGTPNRHINLTLVRSSLQCLFEELIC